MPDAYPFALTPGVEVKLAFVHELILGHAAMRVWLSVPAAATAQASRTGLRPHLALMRMRAAASIRTAIISAFSKSGAIDSANAQLASLVTNGVELQRLQRRVTADQDA